MRCTGIKIIFSNLFFWPNEALFLNLLDLFKYFFFLLQLLVYFAALNALFLEYFLPISFVEVDEKTKQQKLTFFWNFHTHFVNFC